MKTYMKGSGLGVKLRSNTTLSTILSVGVAAASVLPAYAAIDNSATASGTGPAGTVTSLPATESVPVVAASRSMTLVKTVNTTASVGNGVNTAITDALDVIVYRFTITNNGNVTENNVTVNDTNPTFGGVAGTGSYTSAPTEVTGFGAGTGDAATLAPGETVVFEVTYEMSAADVYNATAAVDPSVAVSNTAEAVSDDVPIGDPRGGGGSVTTGVTPSPALEVAKVAVLDDTNGTEANFAEVGETIEYTYTVTNTGNVNITNVSISDLHEGVTITAPTIAGETITTAGPGAASNDLGTDANDGIIDVLTPGSVATFTYIHTVTQTEVDNG